MSQFDEQWVSVDRMSQFDGQWVSGYGRQWVSVDPHVSV